MSCFPLRTYCMIFGYDGTDYHGMQIQMRSNKKVEELKTIEGEIEECFEKLDIFFVNDTKNENFLKKIKWSRVGRTDKGVHSVCQVASFRAKIKLTEKLISILKSESEEIKKYKKDLLKEMNDINSYYKNDLLSKKIENPLLNEQSEKININNECKNEFIEELIVLDYIVNELNSIISNNIKIFKIIRVTKNFDARIDCSRRLYEYIMPEYILLPVSINNEDFEKELLNASNKQYEQELKKLNSIKKRKRDSIKEIDQEENDIDECLDEKNQINKDQEFHQTNRLNNYGFGNNFKLVKYDIEDYLNINKHFNLSAKQLDEFKLIMNEYIGTHSFHNFTSKLNYNDSNSWRHIEDINVEYIDNFNEKDIKIKLIKIIIKGQSFLLHQIRKMVALAIEIFRGTAPKNAIKLCFLPNKLSIHLAPSQGLLLDRVFYDTYNMKRSISSDQNDFAIHYLYFNNKKCQFVQNMEKFKENIIYNKIKESVILDNNKNLSNDDVENNKWIQWIESISKHPFLIDNFIYNTSYNKQLKTKIDEDH